ncbi:unnamed protein product [Periconia digitata]|uniref:Arrestin C-terminal-like domain-containing protein n=1 Tax=Periconia digitata TaxID=1303443 RepID=A0A9W4XLN1_9PLEO|nr:unnamed protein product [Periconia digitata]
MVSNGFGEPRGISSNVASWARPRPLSDIRELTEPSLADTIPQRLLSEGNIPRSVSRSDLSRKPSVASRRPSIDNRLAENRDPDKKTSIDSNGARPAQRGRPGNRTPSPDISISSIYSIPPNSVPPRSSSRVRARSASRSRPPPPVTASRAPTSSLHIVPLPPPSLTDPNKTIPQRGQSQSPLRHIAARLDPISHDTNRRIPSQTFIREPLSAELLEFPVHRHPRVHLELDLSAGIFVGGGSVEGTVQIKIDEADRIRHRRALAIGRISIDLLGLEEASGNRRAVFLNLATELIDDDNPPPPNMVEHRDQIGHDDSFWNLMPSVTNMPFMMSLPLNVGPPPFQSKNAKIRYSVCVSLLIRDQGKQYIVRASEDVTILSVYDPEKALMSLPSPLTASDEWVKPRDVTVEVVKVTAGLHRQVWVSGTSIYVDVHIVNNSRKMIKKIELQLERDLLCYKHVCGSCSSCASQQLLTSVVYSGCCSYHGKIGQSSANLRQQRKIYTRKICNKTGDSRLARCACSSNTYPHLSFRSTSRSCYCEVWYVKPFTRRIPWDINQSGKYFEVRYFLNVIIGSAHTKLVAVQLPIVLIHMNSLDVVPNSVAQVAAAIEEKRTANTYKRGYSPPRLERQPSRSVQGRAFAAPRTQSLERMRSQAEELHVLSKDVDQSPRKDGTQRLNTAWDYRTPPSNRKGKILADGDVADLQNQLRRVKSNDTVLSKSATINRGNSMQSGRKCASSLGFRETEVREDIELGGLGMTG